MDEKLEEKWAESGLPKEWLDEQIKNLMEEQEKELKRVRRKWKKGKDHVFTREFWGRMAKEDPYGAMCPGWSKEDFDKIRGCIAFLTELRPDMTILDLGCGIGRVCKWVCPLVNEYWGVDYSKEMIKFAVEMNKEYLNANFIVNNGKDLSVIRDNSIDLVFSELLFQHVTKRHIKAYLKDIPRVLKDFGEIVLQLPNSEFFFNGFNETELNEILKCFHWKVVRGSGEHYWVIQGVSYP